MRQAAGYKSGRVQETFFRKIEANALLRKAASGPGNQQSGQAGALRVFLFRCRSGQNEIEHTGKKHLQKPKKHSYFYSALQKTAKGSGIVG